MSWVLVGIGAAGATAGGLGGYFGTSKKNRGKKGTQNAILGALGGATLGLGGAGLLGVGAGGAAATGAAPSLAAASQAGYAATAGGIASKMGLGLGSSTAAGSAAASTAGLTGATAAKQGILAGFMKSELGKGMMNQMGGQLAGSMLGGNQPQSQMTDVSFPGVSYTEAPIAPTMGGTSPLAMQTPDWQMQQEILRRRMMGYGY